MRGRVTLAVRGFVGCVGMVALAEVLTLFLVVAMGRGAGAGDGYLIPMVVLYGLSGVQLVLSGVAWFRRGWGWAVWWAVVAWLVAAMVVIVVENAWNLVGAQSVLGLLILLWAGRRVLRGSNGSGPVIGGDVEAGETQVGGGEGGELLAYSRVSRKRDWVGTALVFLGGVMVFRAVSPVMWAFSSFGQSGQWIESWMNAAVATLGVGVVVVLGWRVWGKARRGEELGRGLKGIAVWATIVVAAEVVVSMVWQWVRMSGMGFPMSASREYGLWKGLDVLRQMGPVLFFVMMTWGEEPGAGEPTQLAK